MMIQICLRVLLVVLTFLPLTKSAQALNIRPGIMHSSICLISFDVEGDIDSSDVEKILDIASGAYYATNNLQLPLRCRQENLGPTIQFVFNSRGGDVASAIKIGRIIRSMPDAIVYAQNCASSCVFMFIGGVERNVNIFRNMKGIGLHRFFLQDGRLLSRERIEISRIETRTAILKYLKEMNVSERILEISESVAPEEIKWLSMDEAKELQLQGIDPVHDEIVVAKEAKSLGVSSQEYRRRRSLVSRVCRVFDIDCRDEILLSRPRQEISQLRQTFYLRCKGMNSVVNKSRPDDSIEFDIEMQKITRCIENYVRSSK